MRTVRRTSQFKKDVERMKKRGKDLGRLKEVLEKIIGGQQLEAKYRDHVLVGQYKGTRECHIEPDWLLIYELAQSEVVLIRTGTHADLFG
ncbi:MAG: type II toxin-antitoxin system YafQ family toxin [Chloroflexi bacterium]|jgi:mRNA interferase YafQ|nr:type II toxin-antitoxin system YafQ family toxin [Chloroflexota bacterium]